MTLWIVIFVCILTSHSLIHVTFGVVSSSPDNLFGLTQLEGCPCSNVVFFSSHYKMFYIVKIRWDFHQKLLCACFFVCNKWNNILGRRENGGYGIMPKALPAIKHSRSKLHACEMWMLLWVSVGLLFVAKNTTAFSESYWISLNPGAHISNTKQHKQE